MIKSILQIGNPILINSSIQITFPLQDQNTLLSDLYDTIKSTGDLGAGLSAPQIGINQRVAIIRNFHLEEEIIYLSRNDANAILDIDMKYRNGLLLDKTIYVKDILEKDLVTHLLSNTSLSKKYRKLVLDNLYDYLWFFIINPEIISFSDNKSFMWEGCLSVGEGENALYAQVERSDEIKLRYYDEYGTEKTNIFEGFVSHVIQHEIDHLDGKLFLSLVKDPNDIWKSGDLDKYIAKHKSYPDKY